MVSPNFFLRLRASSGKLARVRVPQTKPEPPYLWQSSGLYGNLPMFLKVINYS